MEIFYERTQRLLGEEAVTRLKATHVCVLGVGGVGSWVAESLIRTGIGQMSIVDFDTVDITNINRQVQALHSTVGQVKVEAMKTRLLDINPEATIHSFNEKIEPDHLPGCLNEADFVVDCIDDVSAKVAIIKWCYEHHRWEQVIKLELYRSRLLILVKQRCVHWHVRCVKDCAKRVFIQGCRCCILRSFRLEK